MLIDDAFRAAMMMLSCCYAIDAMMMPCFHAYAAAGISADAATFADTPYAIARHYA